MRNFFDKIRSMLHDPTFSTNLHKYSTIVWILLIIPGLLFWKESLVFIVLMSLWANVVGHWSSYQASRAEKKIDKSE